MKKRYIRIISMLAAIAMTVSISSAATVIGQDVSQNAVISAKMETQAEATAISSSMPSGGSAVLSDDRVEGKHSLMATSPQTGSGTYVTYTLAQAESYNISQSSIINLWLKAGKNAEWIEFYSAGTLIKCDKNKDGRFEVGKDFESGKWVQIDINLLKAASVLTQGGNLTVRTNYGSVWFYDGVIAQNNQVSSIAMSALLNDNVEQDAQTGSVVLKKTSGDTAFLTTPTVLVSNNRVVLEKTFDKATLDTGEKAGVTALNDGSLKFELSDLCTGGTAIGNGSNVSYAFDDNVTTSYSSQHTNSSIQGNSYIGYNFGESFSITGFSIKQSYQNEISSVKAQWYDSARTQWVDIGTYSLPVSTNGTTVKSEIYFKKGIAASQFRLLANAYPTSASVWSVQEVEFFGFGKYKSPEIDISTTALVEYLMMFYNMSTQESGLEVQTSLSTDGGTTWGEWQHLNSNGTINGIDRNSDLQNAKMKYAAQIAWDGMFDGIINVNDIKVQLMASNHNSTDIDGFLSGIKIDREYKNINGDTSESGEKFLLPIDQIDKFALSGSGKVLYYTKGNFLYKINLQTMESVSLGNRGKIKSLCTTYDGSTVGYVLEQPAQYQLWQYTEGSPTPHRSIYAYEPIKYKLFGDGTLAFTQSGSIRWRSNEHPNIALADTGSFDIVDGEQKKIIICNAEGLSEATLSDDNTWISETLLSKTLTGTLNVVANRTGDKIMFSDNSGNYLYDVTSETLTTIDYMGYKFTDDNKIVGSYYIYDPESNKCETICNKDQTIQSDDSGSVVLSSLDGGKIKIWNRDIEDKIDKYLLSFDGKMTWHSYKNGRWSVVSNRAMPLVEEISKYGMTYEETDAISASDFAFLYNSGKSIYTVDIAIQFASPSAYITPNISSISFITGGMSVATGEHENALYAAKKTDFSGSSYRKVNKLYPVEIMPKSAKYLYFIYADGKYHYYRDGTWQSESVDREITTMILNVALNWGGLSEIGMSAQELRSIPAPVLTSNLAGKDFSVVYCMKVFDESTVGYISKITADYVEDLFASDSLTLNIVLTDGTTRNVTGLTSEEIEDFMEWVNMRQYNKGTIFYRLKTGSTNLFVNYYMIVSVTVVEE